VADPTLIESLRRKGDLEVEAVWQQARADADRRRAEAARTIDEQRAATARALVLAAAEATRAAVADAEHRASDIRGQMKTALAERVHALALAVLPRFRDEAYADVFAALVRELPERSWTRVVVNPADEARARDRFPAATIVSDSAITGGLAVEGGGVRISNTLDTRLAAAWPDLLAGVISDVVDECARS